MTEALKTKQEKLIKTKKNYLINYIIIKILICVTLLHNRCIKLPL